MRKWLFCTFALMLFISGYALDRTEAAPAFHDVTQGFWAAAEISAMAEDGIVSGYEGRVFKPHDPVTREEFATLLANTFYLDRTAPAPTFADVAAERWSFAAIESAKEYLPGYGQEGGKAYFEPKAAAAREDVAAAIVRALGYGGQPAQAPAVRPFRDAADISPLVLDDVLRAAEMGFVQGYEDESFRPKATVTRAEAAAILYRALYGPLAASPAARADQLSTLPLITDFSQAVGWYGTVSHTSDPGRVIEGASSVRLSTDAEHTTTGARLQDLALDLGRTGNLVLRLYVEDIEKLSKIEVRLSSQANMSTYMSYPHNRWSLVPGWNELVIPIDSFTSVGGETFEQPMKTLQVSVTQRGDLPVNVVFDALYRDYGGKGKVLIQFDDGWSSVYTKAFPMMREMGFVGNVGIVSSLAGMSNYTTPDQLKAMYAQGWDIFNHTASHPRLTELTEEQIAQEFASAKAFMMRHQLTRGADFIAYPYGAYNDAVLEIASRYSRYARTTTPDFEVGSPINPYRLKTIELVKDIDPADYQEAIRFAAEHGTTVIFLLHRIEDTADNSITLETGQFQAFLDELASYRNQVEVLSISEWYDAMDE